MWQEARKQEKHIKTLMVDYKRRAERRRDYYERIKQDPIKFLRVYGRPAKLHLDSEVAKAAENSNNMMPWIGDSTILIDRFDARTNLETWDGQIEEAPKMTPVERIEERLCMYERYRCIIHNDFAGVTEAMALKQIELDEKYGDLDKKRKEEEEIGKKSQEPKAAIGFTYEDSNQASGGVGMNTAATTTTLGSGPPIGAGDDSSDSEEEADSDMDIDVELDLATLGLEGRRQLAKSAATFGLHPTDFVQLLSADQQLETELRLAKALEEEKLQLAGRKSRRARRLLKERRAKEKFPKLLTTKVGLLNGQPISRRTVYLSASSSDSGDYPSGEEDAVDDRHVRGSKAAADVRARRARAKPLLTTARGPSVMIGGMTSISLCRRRNRGLDRSDKMRKATACSSASSRSRSGSSSSETRSRRRSSSGLSDSSISVRHSHRDSSRHHGKRPRVEYITTFGDNDDDSMKKHAANSPAGLSWKTSKPPGTAASAVAASVVSKLLNSTSAINKTYSPFPNKSLSDMLRAPVASNSSTSFSYRRGVANRSFSPEGHRRNQRRSPSSRRRGYRSRSRSASPGRKHIGSWNNGRRRERRGHSTTGSESSRSSSKGTRSTKRDYRSSSNRHRSNSSRRSYSRSPLSQGVSTATFPSASSKREESEYSESRPPVPEVSGTNPPSGDRLSPPPVRKRYYRPELESDEDSRLSEEDDGEDDDQQSNRRYSRSSGRGQDSPSTRQTTAATGSWDSSGKMATSGTTEAASYHVASKNTPGSALPGASRPTPQELLKRRVQLQLTKAFNADKKAELEKQVQLEQERLAREEGLRRQARLLRRQEEKRLREERRAAMLASGKPDDSASDTSSSSLDSKTDLCANSRPQLSVPPSSRHSPFPRKSSPSSLSLARRNEHRRSRSISPSRTSRLPSPPSSAGSRSTPSAMRGQKYIPSEHRRMSHLSADYDRFPPSGSRDRFVSRSARPEAERCPPANHYRPSMSSRGTSHWRSNERSWPSPMHQNSSWSSAYPRSNRPPYRARGRYS